MTNAKKRVARGSLIRDSGFVIYSSFDIRISSLLQSRYAESARQFCHLGLRERLALLDSLFHGA